MLKENKHEDGNSAQKVATKAVGDTNSIEWRVCTDVQRVGRAAQEICGMVSEIFTN